MPETISLYQFFQKFPDEESARQFFERKRWPAGVVCAHCDSADVSECKGHIPMPYRCRTCRKHFSVRTGSVLAESRLPLHKWMMAIYMLTTARKGIPSTQMARELGVTQKTAWFLAQRIRETWMNRNGGSDMGPVVEVDETFIGGKVKNQHADQRTHVGRGAVGKIAVVGILDRGGIVRAQPVKDRTSGTLHAFIRKNVVRGSMVCTDTYASYQGLWDYNHRQVNHAVGEYVRRQAHTNGIESFWALLKRGYYGIYHYMSGKHLHRYVNEFAFRHNTSNLSTMEFIEATMGNMVGRRLTYRELVHVA